MNSDATRLWIKNPLEIFTATDECAKGGIVVENNLITEVLALGKQPKLPVQNVFDASNHVVLPGLINTHHHFFQTLTRAVPQALNKELFDWLRALYPIWAGLTPEMLYSASEVALAELLLSGCTTSADHHYLFPKGMEKAIDIQVEAARNMGMRVTLTRGSMSLGEDEAGLPPQSTVQTEDIILEDSERLIHQYHDAKDGSFLQIALAPCSPFSVSRNLMEESAKLSTAHNVRLHTHLAETQDEDRFCEKMFGLRPLDYLEDVGWLNKNTWLAHGIHFNNQEVPRLGRSNIGIAHCPTSNMVLASGVCPTLELEKAGVTIGLAVDGSASNDASNMIGEVRQALYLQRLKYGAAKISHQDVLRWATKGSAALLGRTDIGRLAAGSQADLAFFRLDDLNFSGSHDPLAALLLCQAQRADRVMISGSWRVEEGQITGFDIDSMKNKHHSLAKRLLKTNH
ncbi:MAG: 8-oxoguanine deaminase [Candidatus Azotimanducaceae bacterium]|uniref:8-oxoguanine deaminase n=1 Tax=OM182 bacterium TaxID=2510334 RepID=A0A520S0J2_9GAMM|nr:MAG: 8-oxoguanine deaminase [OM182 bacterium]